MEEQNFSTQDVQPVNVVVPWADNEKDFLLSMRDGGWIVTENNELIYLMDDNTDAEYEVKDSFFILDNGSKTRWLRLYFQVHYPDLDFDKEFDTDQPGVFGRVQERFGYDYQEWTNKEIYRRLKIQLAAVGYKIHWA